ncbi:MAG: glycosyltransferase family 9 protein [Bacteroidota bacterium]
MGLKDRLQLSYRVRRCHLTDALVRRRVTYKPADTTQEKIALVRLDVIGDYILFRPYLKAIRQQKPDAHITLIGNIIWRDYAVRWDDQFIDQFIWIKKKVFYEDQKYRKRLQRIIREAGFHTILNTTYSRSLLFDDAIVRTSGAVKRLGSSGNTENTILKEKLQADTYYTQLFEASPEVLFEYDRHFELLSQWLPSLKHPTFRAPEHFPVRRGGAYMVIFPGASEAYRCWAVEKFAEVGIKVASEKGWTVVLLGGDRERAIGETLEGLLRDAELAVINEIGETSLPDLAERIAHAEFLLSNETMATHLAALYDIPTVCISNGRHRGRFNPYPEHLEKPIRYVYPPDVRDWLEQNDVVTESTYFYLKGAEVQDLEVEEVNKVAAKLLEV